MTSENIALRFVKNKTRFFNKMAFKTYLVKNCRDFLTEQRPENISYWNKSKKAPAENRKCLFFVAGRRIELRTS